jgi:hypothetical protein
MVPSVFFPNQIGKDIGHPEQWPLFLWAVPPASLSPNASLLQYLIVAETLPYIKKLIAYHSGKFRIPQGPYPQVPSKIYYLPWHAPLIPYSMAEPMTVLNVCVARRDNELSYFLQL